MNNTAFNVLCNIAHVVSQEQNIVLDLEITDDCIIARVIPIEYLAEEDVESIECEGYEMRRDWL